MRNAVLVVALMMALPTPGPAEPIAFVLDTEQNSVAAVDLGTSERVGQVRLDGEPEWLVSTPGGRHLLVFDRGPGKSKGDRGWQGKAPSSVTILDPATLERVARVELGWGLFGRLAIVDEASDRLTVLCPGYDAKKAHERTPRELVSVDLARGEVVGRLPVDRRVDHIATTTDVSTLLLFSSWQKKPKPGLSARLAFVDLASLTQLGTLGLPGRPEGPVLSADEGRVYLLDPGDESNNPKKNVDGTLHVVSMADRTLEGSLNAGRDPQGLSLDAETGRLFVLNEGPPGQQKNAKHGELLLFEGAELRARVRVAEKPRFVRSRSEEPERVYVVSHEHLTAVDLGAEPAASWTIELNEAGDGPAEMVIGPEGRRALVQYGGSNRVETVDLAAGVAVASANTGRGGKKFFQNALAALATAGSYYGARSAAASSGGGFYTYDVYTVTPGNTAVRIEPDASRAWVLNTQTDDVTFVDLRTGEKLEAIAAGGNEMVDLGEHVRATVGGKKIHLLDVATRQEKAVVEVDDLQGLFMAPGGEHAVALADEELVCLDGATGAVHERLPGFQRARQIVFWEGAAEAEPAIADADPR